VTEQPPCSLDITSCDFWLFLKLKMALKGNIFDDIDTIKENTMKHLSGILKDSLSFRRRLF
jgi:hypothetical protein